jgi:hypothetical protein
MTATATASVVRAGGGNGEKGDGDGDGGTTRQLAFSSVINICARLVLPVPADP